MIQLRYDNTLQHADLIRNGGNFETDGGIETAVVISLFTDAARTALDATGPLRGGWWADAFAKDTNDKIGSRLWLLIRATSTQEAANVVATEAEAALRWMVVDGVAASVSASAVWTGSALQLSVSISKPNNAGVWKFAWEFNANELE